METIAVLAFFFYLAWAPALTVVVVVQYLRKLQAGVGALLSLLVRMAFLTVVAGPVGIDGPLPGYMPWWAVDVIARGQQQQNYVAHYAVAVTAVLVCGFLIKTARRQRGDKA